MMRRRMGMSQKDLATTLGVSFQQVQKYETAGNRISASRLYQIANAFNVPVGRFFNEIDSGLLINGNVRKMLKWVMNLNDADIECISYIIKRFENKNL